MTKALDQQRSDWQMTWSPSLKYWWTSGCFSGSFANFWRNISHYLGTICAQKQQYSIVFHTDLKVRVPVAMQGIHLSWTYEADKPFACTEATGKLFLAEERFFTSDLTLFSVIDAFLSCFEVVHETCQVLDSWVRWILIPYTIVSRFLMSTLLKQAQWYT